MTWHTFPSQNTMVVILGNGKETLVFRPSNTQPSGGDGVTRQYTSNVNMIAGPVRFSGQNGQAQFQYLGMQFASAGQLYSGELDLPFVYQGNGSVSLGDSLIPEGYSYNWAIYPIDFTGTRVKYYIEINSGSDDPVFLSPLITTIQLRIPPTYDYTSTIGSIIDISSKISEVSERQWFDWSTLLVRTQIALKFDNTYGDLSGFAGLHRAVKYSRWLEYQAGDGTMQPLSAPIDLMTGWGGHRGRISKADPLREFDCVLDDNLWPLGRVQTMVLEPGDGWCCLAYMRYVMNMQGRSDDFIADTFKTCSFGVNPPSCPHLKLPLGIGTNPKVAPSPEQTYLSVLQEILDILFAVLWSDSQGVAQIMPYFPGVYQTPYKGTFYTSESGNPANSDFLSSMWNRQNLTIDTDDLRTGVAFFGLDPATNMVQGTYLNIDDFLPGYTANVHGFRDPLVKISNRFVDPVFTEAYAYAALSRITLPNVWESHDCCFLPNLFALDRYAVDEDNEMISGIIPLVVESVTSRFHVLNPHVMRSTVLGRWAYNLF